MRTRNNKQYDVMFYHNRWHIDVDPHMLVTVRAVCDSSTRSIEKVFLEEIRLEDICAECKRILSNENKRQ